jgi:hypothetical protein
MIRRVKTVSLYFFGGLFTAYPTTLHLKPSVPRHILHSSRHIPCRIQSKPWDGIRGGFLGVSLKGQMYWGY